MQPDTPTICECGRPQGQCVKGDLDDCSVWEEADDLDCTFCGGEGWQDSDDPLWDGADEVPCAACAGTGLRKHQTIF